MPESPDEEWEDFWIMIDKCDNQKLKVKEACVILFLNE